MTRCRHLPAAQRRTLHPRQLPSRQTKQPLLQRFRRLIACRSMRDLDQWLKDAEASELRPFASLSHGIQSDRAAVVNGLTLPWSTGPVEGTVTRIKMLKRQGYGRASTQLLRRRIVSAA